MLATKMAAACATLTILITAPASANIIEITYQGTVSNGTGDGLFGQAGAILNGNSWTADLYFDTSLGLRTTTPVSDWLRGGPFYGSSSPLVGGDFTVGSYYSSLPTTFQSAHSVASGVVIDSEAFFAGPGGSSNPNALIIEAASALIPNLITTSFSENLSNVYSEYDYAVGPNFNLDDATTLLTTTHVTVNAALSAPSTLDLARMADQSYITGSIAPVDGFKSVQSVLGTGGFFAEVFQNGNQVVVAIRGTARSNLYSELKNLQADKSFATGNPDPILTSEVSQAATLLKALVAEPQFAGANFTLTGHSLGGAIAQILGSATALPTTAFDAPGADNLRDALSSVTDFSGVTFSNSGANTNIRLYGDQISLIGKAIGIQYTLEDNPLDEAITNSTPELTVIVDHSPDTIVTQLSAGAKLNPGIEGPTLDFGLAVVPVLGKLEFFVKASDTVIEVDPPSGGSYELLGSPGSPFIKSVALPVLPGVLAYDVEALSDGVWSSVSQFTPAQSYKLGPDTSGFEFWGLDALGDIVTLPSQFIFDVTFYSAGTFDGTLINVSGVPEPRSWLFIIAGVGLLGSFIRFRRRTGIVVA